MGPRETPRVRVRPYFFFSYAHSPQTDGVDGEHPDRLAFKFFQDLRTNILQLTAAPSVEAAGFMDRNLRTGEDWEPAIYRALADCYVFVPMYQPRYFTRPYCGQEWDGFARREAAHNSRRKVPVRAMIPVLWVPVDRKEIPPCAGHLQDWHTEIGENYRRFGLFKLASVEKYRHDYQEATYEIAWRIVSVARATNLRSCNLNRFKNLENVFETPQDPRSREAP